MQNQTEQQIAPRDTAHHQERPADQTTHEERDSVIANDPFATPRRSTEQQDMSGTGYITT